MVDDDALSMGPEGDLSASYTNTQRLETRAVVSTYTPMLAPEAPFRGVWKGYTDGQGL